MAKQPSNDRERLERYFAEEMELFLQGRFVDDPEHSLKAVCHALIWARALDAHLEKTVPNYRTQRGGKPHHDVLAGMRYARNRVIHQLPQLLEVTEGMALPAELPAAFFEISWRSSSVLPPPDPKHQDEDGKQAYERALAGQPVRFALDDLQQFFAQVPKAVV